MLKTITVDDFTVSEAGPLEAARAWNFSQQYTALLQEAQAAGENIDPEVLDRINALSLWAQVAACVTPRIDQVAWLQIPVTTITRLREAAEKLNPDWFTQPEPAKKKK